MKTLKHGEQVKYTGINWEPVITVGTLEGMVPVYFPTVEAAWENHNNFAANNPWSPNPTAWTMKLGACLTANYAGKAAERAAAAEAFKNATVLTEGETVEIEGRQYTVHIHPRADQLSDPIHFIPVTSENTIKAGAL